MSLNIDNSIQHKEKLRPVDCYVDGEYKVLPYHMLYEYLNYDVEYKSENITPIIIDHIISNSLHDEIVDNFKKNMQYITWNCYNCRKQIRVNVNTVHEYELFCSECRKHTNFKKLSTDVGFIRNLTSIYNKINGLIVKNSHLDKVYGSKKL